MSPAQTILLIVESNTLLEEFPASDKPASALEPKQMLQSLYKDIQGNIDRAIGHKQSQILQIAERTGPDLELKVGEIVTYVHIPWPTT